MRTTKELSIDEKNLIISCLKNNMMIKDIMTLTGGSRAAIYKLKGHEAPQPPKKRSGRPKLVDKRVGRYIKNLATKNQLTVTEINRRLNSQISKSSITRYLNTEGRCK